MQTIVKLLGYADLDHCQIFWGDAVELLGGIYHPHPSRVSAPLKENTLGTRRRGSIFRERLLWTASYEIMYSYKFFFGQEYHFKMITYRGQAGLYFSGQTKERRT